MHFNQEMIHITEIVILKETLFGLEKVRLIWSLNFLRGHLGWTFLVYAPLKQSEFQSSMLIAFCQVNWLFL